MRLLAMVLVVAMCSSESLASDARFEQCQKKLKAAHQLDLLHAFDWKPPKAPYVVAGPTFGKIDISAKQGFADTVNCYLVGGDDAKLINFEILDYRSGRRIAEYRNGRLRVD